MTRVVILHAYSAFNRGDGLLVEAALSFVREAVGDDASIVLIAREPESFQDEGVEVLAAPPSIRFVSDLPKIWEAIRHSDLLVGVGGGYARGPRPAPLLKFLVGHSWQMLFAWPRRAHTVYLPQSVGPFPSLLWPILRLFYGGIEHAAVRDDRSLRDLRLDPGRRVPDSAILNMRGRRPDSEAQPAAPVVFTARSVDHAAMGLLRELADRLHTFDGYIQSATLGNDDTAIMERLGVRRMLGSEELLSSSASRRVVIAVRLHAALMAIEAGHYVVHLAYERKGFGAFDDLGLADYCHNVNRFSVDQVSRQAHDLLTSAEARQSYDDSINGRLRQVRIQRNDLIRRLEEVASRG